MNKRQQKKQAKKLAVILEALAPRIQEVSRGFQLVAQTGVNMAEAFRRLQRQTFDPLLLAQRHFDALRLQEQNIHSIVLGRKEL